MKAFSFIIWMVLSVFMALVTLVTVLAVADMGVEAFDLALIFVFCVVTGVCVWQARQAFRALQPPAARKDSAPQAPAGASTGAVPAGGHGPAATPTGGLERMLSRSTDLVESLRDVAHHPDAYEGARQLASMLEAIGLDAGEHGPQATLHKLSRNGQYWISFGQSEVDEDSYDMLIAAEAALNLNDRLSERVRGQELATPDAIGEKRRLLAQTACLEFAHEESVATPAGDFDVLHAIATGAESAPAAFRVTFAMQANVQKGCAVIDLEVPRPRCFAFFSPDEAARRCAARAYAFRSALLIGRIGLAAPGGIGRVVVNCHEHGKEVPVLSLDLDARAAAELVDLSQAPTVDGGALPVHDALHAAAAQDGWLDPVWPALSSSSALVNPPSRYTLPELDNRSCPDELVRIAGAHTFADLGINENAPRVEAWERLRASCGESAERLVSALMAERTSNADITVAEACTRVIEAVLSSDLDSADERQVGRVFVAGDALEEAVRRADARMGASDDEDPSAVVSLLEPALASLDSMALYEDDGDSQYRYFGSVAERLGFNLARGGDCRAVRLVPDAYYNAHYRLVVAHARMGELDKALAHAERICRVAPASVRARLAKTRVLEARQSFLEAVEVAVDAVAIARTPTDVSLALYRLAYLEWQAGREDLAVACYVASLAWGSDTSDIHGYAQSELDDLLSQAEGLRKLEPAEALEKLKSAGIYPGCDDDNAKRIRSAARLCANAGSYELARDFTALSYTFEADDVLMDVYRALER